MLDIEGLGQTEQQTTAEMGASGLMFAAAEDDIIFV